MSGPRSEGDFVSSPKTVSELCALIVRSELIGRTALEDYRALVPDPADASQFAAALVRDGLLTRFQSRLLLQGRWRNFFLAGKYQVLEHLGAGGMGTVFLCEHRHMRRRVAIKVLPPDPDDPTHLDRFRREAQAVAMLDHPNIVRAFDLDREGKVHFMVMEYIDGASLQYMVDVRGPLPVDRAVNYLAQAALGLQHAADAGLVHRDVKPSNLMVDWTGTVKVLDLGLARFAKGIEKAAQANENHAVFGTADYVAPEQARGSAVDVRGDVYALGAVAYFLLTGKPPFHGGSVASKLIRHQTEVPTPVCKARPDVPEGVSAVIDQMLAKDPGARPTCPARVIAEFEPWIVDVPPPTRDEMPSTRISPHRDVDTKAQHSTMNIMTKSNRSLILKTMLSNAETNG
jgi:eukaryotic-like serine/threonine-protein kinase